MNALPEPISQKTQPGKTGMGGLGHRTGHIEMKDRLGAGPFLGDSSPTAVPGARLGVAQRSVSDEIDISGFQVRGAGADESHPEKSANEVPHGALGSSAEERKNRGLFPPGSARLRTAARRATGQDRAGSSTCEGLRAAEPPPARTRVSPRRPEAPSDSFPVLRRPSNRCRYSAWKEGLTRSGNLMTTMPAHLACSKEWPKFHPLGSGVPSRNSRSGLP